MTRFVTFILTGMFIFIIVSGANAGWQLYDDFESGTIDTEKWNIDNSSADIVIENGQVKFTHKENFPNDSSWMNIKQNKYSIKGIKAKITVDSCTGDVRGRVGGDFAMSTDIWAFASIQLSSNSEHINSFVSILDFSDTFLYDAFFGNFKDPINIMQTSHIVGLKFENNRFTFFTEEFGEIVDAMPGQWSLIDDSVSGVSKGIGTRSTNGDGPCVVYFDDVYVLKSGGSPSIPLLLLDDN